MQVSRPTIQDDVSGFERGLAKGYCSSIVILWFGLALGLSIGLTSIMGNSCVSPCVEFCPECISKRCCKYSSPVLNEEMLQKPQSPLRIRHVPVGSMVRIYKQDPSIDALGVRMKWLPVNIDNGPSSSDIVIRGLREPVRPSDNERNFLYHPSRDDVQFDAVNAFAVVSSVLHMYRRALHRLGVNRNLQWQWGDDPIRVYPRAGELANAMYSRQHRSLVFYYFKDPETKNYVYTARSFDIVAHETGHAILDSLKPNYIGSSNPETGALHESFGDLTSIFAILSDLEMCEAVIAHSKGNLHNHSFFSVIGEEFGKALGRNFGLRNADENLRIDEVSTEVHDLSRVFTSAVYDILVDMYDLSRDVEKFNPAETLFRIGKHLISIFIIAFVKAPSRDCRFRDVANNMIKEEKVKEYRSAMVRQFEFRKIRNLRLEAQLVEPLARKHVCGTMQVPTDEHLALVVQQTCSFPQLLPESSI